jgi:hypothetical protein
MTLVDLSIGEKKGSRATRARSTVTQGGIAAELPSLTL